jgi:hypothetical protein
MQIARYYINTVSEFASSQIVVKSHAHAEDPNIWRILFRETACFRLHNTCGFSHTPAEFQIWNKASVGDAPDGESQTYRQSSCVRWKDKHPLHKSCVYMTHTTTNGIHTIATVTTLWWWVPAGCLQYAGCLQTKRREGFCQEPNLL